MLKIDPSRQAQKFLRQLERSNAKHARQIAEKLAALLLDPVPPDSLAMVNMAPYRRAAVGEYRIVYFVDGESLKIVVVGRRNDDSIYRLLRHLD